MKYNKFYLFLTLILLNFKFYNCTINDNFYRNDLEGERGEILDVTDDFNLNLVVTTSKNIYTGIPPTKKDFTITANFINSTSILTITKDYILAACLKDSLLTQISLIDGASKSFLNYSSINITPQLTVPTKTCSISTANYMIYIGYSRDNGNNITNILIKLKWNIKDVEVPSYNSTYTPLVFTFPKNTAKTDSSRQISCQPLSIFIIAIDNETSYRLVCVFERIEFNSDFNIDRAISYGTSIAKNFREFNNRINDTFIYATNISGGFRLYKLNDTYGRFVMRKVVYDLHLELYGGKIIVRVGGLGSNSFYTDVDLFDYNSGFLFTGERIDNFLNMENIYFFRIYKLGIDNYNIIIYYQTSTHIKFFCLKYIDNIFNINKYEKTLKLKTNKIREYDVTTLIDGLSDLGDLYVENMYTNKDGVVSNEYFGIDYNNTKMNNNKMTIKASFNTTYKYNLSFIDQNENEYIRIYYLYKIFITAKTCYSLECITCYEDYNQCDDYESGNYALLIDNEKLGYPTNKSIKGYIYNSTTNKFEKCYSSCDFCYESSGNTNEQKCESCADGYLLSYGKYGNCYKINNLGLTDEKAINDNENYVSSSCSIYKININGECVEECPTSTPFYIYNYNETTEQYTKNEQVALPKYLYNKKCYDSCPSDSNIITDETNNKCKCKYAFHTLNNEITCYSDENCITGYPYQNPDTKECYSSLENCLLNGNNYFFNKFCYTSQCPNDKFVSLSSKSNDIKEYYKTNLLLNDDLIDKICICNSNVWSNITSDNENYYQNCLEECPEGYEAESITNQCIEKKIIPTTQIILETTIITEQTQITEIVETTQLNIATTELFKEPTTNIETTEIVETTQLNIPTTELFKEPTTNIETTEFEIINTELSKEATTNIEKTEIAEKKDFNIATTELSEEQNINTTEIKGINEGIIVSEKTVGIINQEELHKDPDNCKVMYENNCLPKCPENTCINKDDPELKTCLPIEENVKVYNYICFENLNELTNNIKTLSDNNTVISTESGITIRGYSTKTVDKEIKVEDDNVSYTLVYLGECEDKLREYYKLPDYIDIFIFGIDSPNKNKSYATSVYNYEVYLENGTQLDYMNVCEGTKISISSSIVDTDLVKLVDASYFSDLGYDIYNDSNSFYNDVCAPASINGNDITLEDRKKYYSTSNISLCNESCSYSSINFTTKRFICECDAVYNSSDNSNDEDEGHISSREYFLSFINYKITTCYKLFLKFSSYYYNAGFYIAIATTFLYSCGMIIFIRWGLIDLNKQILNNIPNKLKLKQMLKDKEKIQKRKMSTKVTKKENNNPPKSLKL